MEQETHIYYLKKGRDLFIYLSGSITAQFSYSLFEYIKPHLEQSNIERMWIDMSKTHYIDSTTIGALIKLHKYMKDSHREAILCNCTDEVLDILYKTHLGNYLKIVERPELKKIEDKIHQKITIEKRSDVPEEFVLDTHHNLVNAAPELKEQFNTLFQVLEAQIKNKKNLNG